MVKAIIFAFLCSITYISGCGVVCSNQSKLLVKNAAEKESVYLEADKCFVGFGTATRLVSYELYLQRDKSKVSLRDIVTRTDRFFRTTDYHSKSQTLRHDFYSEHISYAEIFELMAAKFDYDLKSTSQAKHVVCVDPLVVIVTPKSVYNINAPVILYSDFVTNELLANVRENGDWYYFTPSSSYEFGCNKANTVTVSAFDWNDASIIYKGCIIGAKIAENASNMLWFSPDMDKKPQPVEIDTNGIGHIPVPWGELILTWQGSQWVITAEVRVH